MVTEKFVQETRPGRAKWRPSFLGASPISRARSGYMDSLDGWRAIAVVLVCFFHDRVHQTAFYSTALLHKYGDRGVDLFFAISGVLICTRLLQEESKFGRISLKNFYVRRLCRIQPAALTYLFTVEVLSSLGFLTLSLGGFVSALFLFRNFYPFHGGLNPSSTLTNHFWSLSIEEHFYLFLPVFLVLTKRRRIPILVLMVLIFSAWPIVVHKMHLAGFGPLPEWRTDLRINALLIPALFALLLASEKGASFFKRWLNPYSAFAVSAIFVAWERWHMSAISAFAAGLTFPLLVTSTVVHSKSIITRILEFNVLKVIGRLSYSLYLWQQLILGRPQWLPGVQFWQIRYLWLLAFASVSYFLIEKPVIRLGHRLAPPATPGRQDL